MVESAATDSPVKTPQERQHGFAFIGNVLNVRCALPVEVIPNHYVRAADAEQVQWIRHFLNQYPSVPFNHPCQRYETLTICSPADSSGQGQSFQFLPLPDEDLRYFIIEFEGSNYAIHKLQTAANLADLELDLIFTLIRSGGGYGKVANPHVVFQFYQDGLPPIQEWPLTLAGLEQIRLLMDAIECLSDEHQDIARALQMFEALKNLPRQSEFQILGLFGIIELLITHAPSTTEVGDSIRHQVRTKIPLLSRHSGQPFEYSAFFEGCSEEKVWNLLYDYRSRLAHGGFADFTKGLRFLRDRGTAT
jgi:hypothetical protein